VLKVSSIRVLDESSGVPICIPQIFGEGVRSQEIETVGETLVQRGLERVIEHLQLRVVERKNRRHIRLLVEVPSAEVWSAVIRIGSAEIGIENLQRLVQITRLVIPQVSGSGADVPDLGQEIVSELMLQAKTPFHNAGNDALWSRGLHRS